MPSFRTLLRIARIVFAGACALTAATTAQAQTFNPEVRISAINGQSYMPNIATVGSNVYAVWVENPGPTFADAEIFFSRSTNDGGAWSAPVNLSNNGSRQDRIPVITASGTDVHIFWTDNVVDGEIYYRRSIDSGATFLAEQKLTSASGYSRPTSALVEGGRLHLAWYDDRTVGYGQVYHQYSCDRGANWSPPVNVTRFDGVVDNEAPRLTTGTDGSLYLLMRTSRNGIPQGGWPPFDQYLLRASNLPACPSTAEVGWIRPAQKASRGFPEEIANTYGGNLASGASNALHVAYWSDKAGNNLVYRRGFPNGKGFEAPIDLSGFGMDHLQWDGTYPEMTGFGIAEDSSQKVHAVFGENTGLVEGFQAGKLYYRCSDDQGVSFRPRQLATGALQTAQPRAVFANGRFHMIWMDFRHTTSGSQGAEIYYRSVTGGVCAAANASLGTSTTSLSFGGQSMQTTSQPQAVTVTNTGSGTLSISSVSASANFAQTNNCSSLAAGATCTINVTFTPTGEGTLNGTLTIGSNATSSPDSVSLTGVGERSLVTHYYRSILRRAPDSGGKAFWEGEAARMASLGANVNETWYAMATFFFFSAEYLGFNRNNSDFVTDLYNTFFNRAPDGGGLSFWTGQLSQGMPREVVLVEFMLSTEFITFTQGIFGNTAVRAEIDTVIDFYRGLLSRLPDDGGFGFWRDQFRVAQCQGAGAVYSTVESISSQFATGGEYLGRGRTNAQYVGDLYNAFLRRGGDLGGVQYWINELNTAARTRENVRVQFIASPEFTNRVNAIIAQGCLS